MRHCHPVLAALSCVFMLAGCFDAVTGAAAIRCSSQAECPRELTCVVERGACFTSEQIAGRVCGDGFIGGDEACDDGPIGASPTSPAPPTMPVTPMPVGGAPASRARWVSPSTATAVSSSPTVATTSSAASTSPPGW